MPNMERASIHYGKFKSQLYDGAYIDSIKSSRVTSGLSTPNPFFFRVNFRCCTADGVIPYTLPMAGFDIPIRTITHKRISSRDKSLKRARIFDIRRSSISSSNCSTSFHSFDVILTWVVQPFSFIVISVLSMMYLCKCLIVAVFFW